MTVMAVLHGKRIKQSHNKPDGMGAWPLHPRAVADGWEGRRLTRATHTSPVETRRLLQLRGSGGSPGSRGRGAGAPPPWYLGGGAGRGRRAGGGAPRKGCRRMRRHHRCCIILLQVHRACQGLPTMATCTVQNLRVNSH